MPRLVTVPGRVNLIGEHIDYHDLSVLPMAIPRAIRLKWEPSASAQLRVSSEAPYGERAVPLDRDPEPGLPGDWGNYARAAVRACRRHGPLSVGVDARIFSDLPPAAGLSSSSALLTALAIALLQANGVEPGFESLMEILPEGEQFVGTRGGGMDHAAILGARSGCALEVGFAPLRARPVHLPEDWEWLAAHSLVTAEKSGALREEFNARRRAGGSGIRRLGWANFREALSRASAEELGLQAQRRLEDPERRCVVHVLEESARVEQAVRAIEAADLAQMGRLLDASHASLRHQLRVSRPELDSLVESARLAGAAGARLTGAGFGGFALILCPPGTRARVRDRLLETYYASREGFDPGKHLIDIPPSAGALELIARDAG